MSWGKFRVKWAKAQIEDLHLNCCIPKGKAKNNLTGRKQRANRPIFCSSFGPLKGESILPIQPVENNEGKALFDLQTIAFGGFKSNHFIAEIHILGTLFLLGPGYPQQNLNYQKTREYVG